MTAATTTSGLIEVGNTKASYGTGRSHGQERHDVAQTRRQQMTEFPATAHHVGLTVTDVEVSRQWYQRLLNAAPVLDEDFPAVSEHHQGFHKVVFVLPGGFVLGLVAHPATDRNRRFDEFGPGLDHIGFGCADRSELEKWQKRLDELGIEHGVIAEDAAGFALAFRDLDNIALEFWAPRS